MQAQLHTEHSTKSRKEICLFKSEARTQISRGRYIDASRDNLTRADWRILRGNGA